MAVNLVLLIYESRERLLLRTDTHSQRTTGSEATPCWPIDRARDFALRNAPFWFEGLFLL